MEFKVKLRVNEEVTVQEMDMIESQLFDHFKVEVEKVIENSPYAIVEIDFKKEEGEVIVKKIQEAQLKLEELKEIVKK